MYQLDIAVVDGKAATGSPATATCTVTELDATVAIEFFKTGESVKLSTNADYTVRKITLIFLLIMGSTFSGKLLRERGGSVQPTIFGKLDSGLVVGPSGPTYGQTFPGVFEVLDPPGADVAPRPNMGPKNDYI